MPKIKTFYDELGVGRNATAGEIKHAFKEVAKIYHPDKNPPEKQEWAHGQMSRLNFIVQTLLEPKTRAEYDGLVTKYESGYVPQMYLRRPREQDAIERQYARVSVEILNLRGKGTAARLKMMLGFSMAFVALFFALVIDPDAPSGFHISPPSEVFPTFFALIGGIIGFMGVADYLSRGSHRKRLRELERRQSELRRRMYDAWSVY